MDLPFRGSSSPLTRGRLRTSAYRRAARDVYVLSDAPASLALQCRALQLAVPDGVVSHASAACLLGLPVPARLLARVVHLTRPPGSAPVRRPQVVAHVRALSGHEVVVRDGVRVTTAPRTFLDLAPVLGREDLVVLADAAARSLPPGTLEAAVHAAARRKGVRAAREALARADAGAASPAETRTRLLLHGAGHVGLRHGVVVRDEHGQWLAEPDLADPAAGVAVQYDGVVHLEGGRERWQHDVDRDELTRLAGWEVVVLTGKDLAQPHRAVAKVAAAYQRAADRAAGAELRRAAGGS